MRLPQNSTGGDAGRTVRVLGGNGIDGAAAGCGKYHSEHLALKRSVLHAVAGVVRRVAIALDEDRVLVQRRGVQMTVQYRRLPNLAEASGHVGGRKEGLILIKPAASGVRVKLRGVGRARLLPEHHARR